MSALLRKPDVHATDVELQPMRRRHLRQVLRIENEVYPRPWSATLFLQEIVRRSDRAYLVAKSTTEVVGYGGLMVTGTEGHVTTIAVDPALHRHHIGTKILLGLIDIAMERGCKAISLEVRKSNSGAQRMYEQFGFRPIGVRRGYYIETGEDAIVMWADDVDGEEYRRRLEPLRRKIQIRRDGE